MPSKYRIKTFTVGKIYHIYNRGLDDREVFGGGDEFELLEQLLKRYLTDYAPEQNSRFKGEKPYRVRHKQEMVLRGKVDLLAYCLMPDHMHLLLAEKETGAITRLLRRILTFYSMEYNRKRKRRGPVFLGTYKAVEVEGEEMLKAVSRLIHLNPVVKSIRRFALVETVAGSRLDEYRYSSYQDYVSGQRREWVNPMPILDLFGGDNTQGRQAYRNYVEKTQDRSENAGELMMDIITGKKEGTGKG